MIYYWMQCGIIKKTFRRIINFFKVFCGEEFLCRWWQLKRPEIRVGWYHSSRSIYSMCLVLRKRTKLCIALNNSTWLSILSVSYSPWSEARTFGTMNFKSVLWTIDYNLRWQIVHEVSDCAARWNLWTDTSSTLHRAAKWSEHFFLSCKFFIRFIYM